jgi:hypothetical protein
MIQAFPKNWIKRDDIIVTSPFGWRTSIDKPSELEFHSGIDLRAAVGTAIHAPFQCTVTVAMTINTVRSGKYIKFNWIDRYQNKFEATICHLDSLEVATGNYAAGTLLCKSGNTGASTGAHIHLSIRSTNSQTLYDPKEWFQEPIRWPKGSLYNQSNILTETIRIDNIPITFQYFDPNRLVKESTLRAGKKVNETIASETEKASLNLDNVNDNAGIESRLAPGIWQIVKLLIDSSVRQRQVVDSSISVQQGSLLNFFNKVCQKPMVEFFGDTYGNQYYFFVRKPPFDREGMNGLPTFLSIQSVNLISCNFDWESQEIYSWYKYMPQGTIMDAEVLKRWMPAVFFAEFAAIWGSKPCVVESNYYNYKMSGLLDIGIDAKNRANADEIVRNCYYDFRYLIESQAYRPFTRKGTITAVGDRRFKRGTRFYFPYTQESFYIENVQQNFAISGSTVQRTMTLTVSHGVYEPYVKGKRIVKQDGSETDKNVSYFNVIDFGDENLKREDINVTNWTKLIAKWKVNLDTFGFFLRRQQTLEDLVPSYSFR